jgi:AraC-like DNA-binding protein
MDSLVLPSPALIERLERRFRPPSYFLGANSAGFRTIRELTLFARRPSSATTMDVHHRHLLVAPLTGEVVVVAGDRGHAVRAGEALLVLPFVAHHYRLVSAERPMLLFIGFEAAMGELEAGGVNYGPLGQAPRSVGAEGWSLVDAIDRELDRCPSLTPCLLALLLERLMACAVGDGSAEAVEHRAWLRTCRVAQHAVAEPFANVPELARACGSSESALRADVAAVTGQSLGVFVRRLRIYAAIPLVYRRDLAGATVAAGYQSVEAFSKAFKAEIGEAPSHRAQGLERRRASWGR